MKKLLVSATLMLVLGAPFVNAQSVTYQISAIIPAIVGVNVPDPNEMDAGMVSNAQLEKMVERTFRNDQAIILETFVPR